MRGDTKRQLARLAAAFNAMLSISPGHFGTSPASLRPGKGVILASERIRSARDATNARLAGAEERPPSRQVLRRAAIRAGKMPLGMTKKEWDRRNGRSKGQKRWGALALPGNHTFSEASHV